MYLRAPDGENFRNQAISSASISWVDSSPINFCMFSMRRWVAEVERTRSIGAMEMGARSAGWGATRSIRAELPELPEVCIAPRSLWDALWLVGACMVEYSNRNSQ